MDELFGDPFAEQWPRPAGAPRAASRRASTSTTAATTPRAVVKAELAGRRHRHGRARGRRPRAGDHRRAPGGRRPRAASTSRSRSRPARSGAWSSSAPTWSPSAPRASYDDGILRVELPLAGQVTRRVPIEPAGRGRADGNGDGIQVVETRRRRARRSASARAEPLPAALPVLPLKDTVAYPDTLTPLAVGQDRSMRLVDDVLGGERTLVLVASRDPELDEPGPDQLYDVGVVGVSRGCSRSPTARCGSSSRRPSGCGSATTSPRSPTWSRGSRRCPTRSSPRPSSRR